MISHTVVMRLLISHPFISGTEHAGLSQDQRRNQPGSAKRHDLFGELYEGSAVSCKDYSTRSILVILHLNDSLR